MRPRKNPVLTPRPYCRFCRGEGMVLVPRAGGGRWMVRCECRKPKPNLTMDLDFTESRSAANE